MGEFQARNGYSNGGFVEVQIAKLTGHSEHNEVAISVNCVNCVASSTVIKAASLSTSFQTYNTQSDQISKNGSVADFQLAGWCDFGTSGLRVSCCAW
jgi:hypothetical protein